MDARKLIIILLHGLIGWALCGAVMGIGMSVTTTDNALIVHAIAAPVIFSAVSLVYYRRFGYSGPLQTAISFTAIVVCMDFFLVALVVNRSLGMFYSVPGTWIPFALIFTSTYLTGLYVAHGKNVAVAATPGVLR